MHRIGFYKEDETVMAELQEVTRVNTEEAKGRFHVEDKPVYLQIFIYRPLDSIELTGLYHDLLSLGLIQMDEDELAKTIKDDMDENRPCRWEIRCKDFAKAFEFARAAVRFWPDDMLAVQISDEPSEGMKNWIDSREEHTP